MTENKSGVQWVKNYTKEQITTSTKQYGGGVQWVKNYTKEQISKF